MSDYKNFVAEDRRLAILRFLAEEQDYSLNESVLQTALSSIGHAVARDVVRSDLEFLRDIALVKLEKVMNKDLHFYDNYDLPLGIVEKINDKYSIIDGYHRIYKSNTNYITVFLGK